MLFHVNKHEENEMKFFQCNHCQSRFKKKEKLDQHIQKKHSGGFECETCGKKFPEQSSLKEHVRVRKEINIIVTFTCMLRCTQGRGPTNAQNVVKLSLSSQRSLLIGLNTPILQISQCSPFQEDALQRAGTLRGRGQAEALLLLRHLWKELRQQGKSEASQAARA